MTTIIIKDWKDKIEDFDIEEFVSEYLYKRIKGKFVWKLDFNNYKKNKDLTIEVKKTELVNNKIIELDEPIKLEVKP